ncbi:hypothetical protein AVEN_64859-1 [Araneus ventricosus]|uniref:Peptidase aspartic putative domain-containing protein n=1 Tax=Araneus ventricosus TaxID=182803 RepID=A0A4Y2GPA4_ARAVE|nr:hypothetical protein AVEN_64859-1 [Araneus ventricosus]
MIQSKLDSVLELCAKIECLKLDYYDITEDEQIADNDAEFEKMEDVLEYLKGKHNRLLCRNQNIRSAPNVDMTPTLQTGETPSLSHPVNPDLSTPAVGGESTLHTLSSTNKIKNAALHSTAVVWVYSPSRSSYVQGRVLLDCGFQSNFLSCQFAAELELSRRKINVPISGFSGSTTIAKWIASTMICNGNSYFSSVIDLLIVPKITYFVPSKVLNIVQFYNNYIILRYPKNTSSLHILNGKKS